jgi:hypothetical protein
LDKALAILVERYHFTSDDLQYGGTERPSLTELARQVCRRLSNEDRLLLPIAAVKMIFASGEGTIRKEGNIAAHNASLEDMELAALSIGLEGNKLWSFINVYNFARNGLQ